MQRSNNDQLLCIFVCCQDDDLTSCQYNINRDNIQYVGSATVACDGHYSGICNHINATHTTNTPEMSGTHSSSGQNSNSHSLSPTTENVTTSSNCHGNNDFSIIVLITNVYNYFTALIITLAVLLAISVFINIALIIIVFYCLRICWKHTHRAVYDVDKKGKEIENLITKSKPPKVRYK